MKKHHRLVNRPMMRASRAIHLGAQVLTILLIIVVVHESLIPSQGDSKITHFDKIIHLVAYGALATFGKLGWPKLNSAILALSLITLGAFVEVAQGIMSVGRTGSLADGIANSLGVILGIGFAGVVLTVMNRKLAVSHQDSFQLAADK